MIYASRNDFRLRHSGHRYQITRSLAIRLAAYGTMLFALGFLAVVVLLGKDEHIRHPGSTWLLSGLKITAVYFVTLVPHEAVHGFFFWVFGGHPKFGAGLAARFLPYFYATSPGDLFTLFQMTVIALVPFVILSIASLGMMLFTPALATIAATAFLTNFSGAAGDLWFSAQIFRFRRCRDLRMIDLESGLAIYSSDPSAKEISERVPIQRAGTLGRLFLRWFVASVILFTSITPTVIVLDLMHRPSTTIGPSWFPLFSVDFIWHKSKLEQVPHLLTSRVHGFCTSSEYLDLNDRERTLPGVVASKCALYLMRIIDSAAADPGHRLTPVESSAIDVIELLASSAETAIRGLVIEEIYETFETKPKLWEIVKSRLKTSSLALCQGVNPSPPTSQEWDS